MLKKLIIGLILLSIGAVALALATDLPKNQKTDKAQKAQYPPYPDVWDWQVPESDRPIDVGFKVKQMDNGDVMIAYRPDKEGKKYKYITFFGKAVVTDTRAVYKDDYGSDAKYKVTVQNNFILDGGGHGGTRSGGCYDALSFDVDVYDNTLRKMVFHKKLLQVFDKPKYYETHYPRCFDGPSFNYQVSAVDARYLPLKDGTFLMIIPEGYIIRFDEKYQTRSKLINDRFFWMDTDTIEDFEAKYGDRVDGDVDLKQLYTDLYQLLLKKRGEKR
jgi:hypothetical protein